MGRLFDQQEQGKTNIDHWNELKHLDFKITSSMFDDKKSYECLQKFLTNDQDEKVDIDEFERFV